MKKRTIWTAAVTGSLVLAAASGCGRTAYDVIERTACSALSDTASHEEETQGDEADSSSNSDSSLPAEAERLIFVYVCGEVQRPGVYGLPPGARAAAAIAAAGGVTPEADLTAVNQARILADGEQLTVFGLKDQPAHQDLSGTVGNDGPDETGGGTLVNINTADASALMTLKGIGEARAADIIAYRDAHGPFEKIEDIMKVSGIKDAAFQKIRDSICVS